MSSFACNYCENTVSVSYSAEAKPELHNHLKIAGRKQNDCPCCGASVQERQLKFYFDQVRFLHGRSRLRILHFNPKPNFKNYLGKFKPELHILAMNNALDKRFESIDIGAIPYSNETFDLIVVSDELEAVDSFKNALTELNRILKPDGLLVLQTSFSQVLESTWEDSGLNSEYLRTYGYGVGHHRRLFGRDLMQTIGFYLNSNILQFSQLVAADNPHALDEHAPFMLFRKQLKFKKIEIPPSNLFLDKDILVSIMCVTYNHANYIDDAINSFISQKTNFRFEIVIGEDGSSDGTLEKIRIWVERYPHLIKLLPDKPNMGAHLNFDRTYAACTGRYIAYCEGDDYWTDHHKLQKQFDYMESNPDCSITYGNVQAHKDGSIDYDYIGGAKVDLPSNFLQYALPINTLTVMFRNVLGKLPPEMVACGAGDLFIWSLLGQHGYGHYMCNILPSVYNMHTGGANSLKGAPIRHCLRLKTYYAAFQYYKHVGIVKLAEYFLYEVAKDAAHIANICSVDQARALLGGLVKEVSLATINLENFDNSKLEYIIDYTLKQLDSYDIT